MIEHEQSFDEYCAIKEKWDDLKAQEADIMQNFSKDNILQALDEKMATLKSQEDEIKNEFKNDEMAFEDYIEKYRTVREQVNKYNILKKKIN